MNNWMYCFDSVMSEFIVLRSTSATLPIGKKRTLLLSTWNHFRIMKKIACFLFVIVFTIVDVQVWCAGDFVRLGWDCNLVLFCRQNLAPWISGDCLWDCHLCHLRQVLRELLRHRPIWFKGLPIPIHRRTWRHSPMDNDRCFIFTDLYNIVVLIYLFITERFVEK